MSSQQARRKSQFAQRENGKTQRNNEDNQTRTIHVFVDNSNVYRVAIDIAKVARLVEGGRWPGTRLVGGSTRSGALVPPTWVGVWEQQGYAVRCVEQGSSGEELVDDMLHANIYCTLMTTHLNEEPPQTLVLLTGDGNRNGFKAGDVGTDFLQCCEHAVLLGWTVEVWSWFDSLSGAYGKLQQNYPDHVQLQLFDTFREEVG